MRTHCIAKKLTAVIMTLRSDLFLNLTDLYHPIPIVHCRRCPAEHQWNKKA